MTFLNWMAEHWLLTIVLLLIIGGFLESFLMTWRKGNTPYTRPKSKGGWED